MEKLNALPGDQSTYREFHSTETALCGIVSDLLEYMDEGKCAILILLDLSAAFDTVDHELLIDDFMYIRVEGVALKWFKSYLENRSYHFIINGTKSERTTLHRGATGECFRTGFVFNLRDRACVDSKSSKRTVQNVCR